MVYVLLHEEPDMTFLNSTLDVKVKRYDKIALFYGCIYVKFLMYFADKNNIL